MTRNEMSILAPIQREKPCLTYVIELKNVWATVGKKRRHWSIESVKGFSDYRFLNIQACFEGYVKIPSYL